MVRCWPVKLSDVASKLIRRYFVVSRRLRPNCLPIGAVNTITKLSEAFTRLSLQREVTSAHVLAVLFLYEQAMTAVFGPCLATACPPATAYRHLAQHVQIDSKLNDFSSWVNEHISSLLGELEE